MNQIAHVAQYKKDVVSELCDLFAKYPIVGAVNMENLPAPQLQMMTRKLRGKVTLYMTKRRLIKIAIEQSKNKVKGLEQLSAHLGGMPALLFTNDNPFSLFKTLKKSKSKAPAKGGQTAPRDLVIPAGPTPFAPGPIIGELAMIGIKAGVEGGKVAVKQDSVVAKEGEKLSPKVAEILTRLGIEPMEVGLDLVAVLEKGVIYAKNVLDIDEEKFTSDLANASASAMNLAVFASYPTKQTIEVLLSKAHTEAKSLGFSENIIDKGIIDMLLAKGKMQAQSLQSMTSR